MTTVDAGPGELFVVSRIGPAADGGVLSNAGAAVALESRAMTTGAVLASVPLPTAASGSNQPFVVSGSATSEGQVAVSTDGRYLVIGGYADVPGRTGIVAATGVNRVVARVERASGNVNTATLVTDAYLTNNLRAVASVDGMGYWLAGNATAANGPGIRYVVQGSTGATAAVHTSVLNTRAVGIFNNQLYASTGSTLPGGADVTTRVYAVGTGTPMTTAAGASLTGVALTNAHNFAFFDNSSSVAGLDLLYVDDSADNVGVRKYTTTDGTTWTQVSAADGGVLFNGGLSGDGGTGFGCMNMAARKTGTDIVLLCTTTEGTANRVVRWVDPNGAAAAPVAGQTLSTAGTDVQFRGIAIP